MGELKRRGEAASSESTVENNLKAKIAARLKKTLQEKGQDVSDADVNAVVEMSAKVSNDIKNLGGFYLSYQAHPSIETGSALVQAVTEYVEHATQQELSAMIMAGLEAHIRLFMKEENDDKGDI